MSDAVEYNRAKNELYDKIRDQLQQEKRGKELRHYFHIQVSDPKDEYIIQEQTDETIEYLESAVPVALPAGVHIYDFNGYYLKILVKTDGTIRVLKDVTFSEFSAVEGIPKSILKLPVTYVSTRNNRRMGVINGPTIIFKENLPAKSPKLYFLQETETEIWFYGIMNLYVTELLAGPKNKPIATQRLETIEKKYLVKFK